MGIVSCRGNDVLEDTVAGGDLDGLAVDASLQEFSRHIWGEAPLPEDDTCTNKQFIEMRHVQLNT